MDKISKPAVYLYQLSAHQPSSLSLPPSPGPILLAVNPFKRLPGMYTEVVLLTYFEQVWRKRGREGGRGGQIKGISTYKSIAATAESPAPCLPFLPSLPSLHLSLRGC